MTLDDFYRLFDDFHTSAVRLETLPAYGVGEYEGERLRAFLAGGPLPVRSVGNDPWMARLAATTAAGKTWRRVRVIDEPPTDYQRFELAVYPETQAVGEDIRLLTRSAVSEPGPDVWLFDPGTPDARIVQMSYAPDGTWLGIEPVDDDHDLAGVTEWVEQLWAQATPLNEYLSVTHG